MFLHSLEEAESFMSLPFSEIDRLFDSGLNPRHLFVGKPKALDK
jgi:hypothetical protein